MFLRFGFSLSLFFLCWGSVSSVLAAEDSAATPTPSSTPSPTPTPTPTPASTPKPSEESPKKEELLPGPIPEVEKPPVIKDSPPSDLSKAMDEESPKWDEPDRSRLIWVNFGFFKYDYKEDLGPPLKSTENAVIPGFGLGAQRTWNRSVMVRGSLNFGFGDTTYDGTDQVGNPLLQVTKNTFVDSEIVAGLKFLELDSRIRPAFWIYTGYGIQYWERILSSYTEQYSWMYVPLGLIAQLHVSPEVRVDIDFAVKFPFFGEITASFSDLDSNLNDGQGLLGVAREGWRLQVPVHYFISETDFALSATPWLEYSSFSNGPDFPVESVRGQLITVAHEPPSRTWRYGLILGGEMRF